MPGNLRADDSQEKSLHHMFNANLLDPGEIEVSVAGNGRIGLTEQLEIGTQGAASILFASPNISLKHEMFRTSSFHTAFNAHLFYSRRQMPDDPLGADAASTEPSSETMTIFLGYVGAMTTLPTTARNQFSFGAYDFFLRLSTDSDNAVMKIQALSPTIAYDHYFARKWGVTAALAYPAYILLSQDSDLATIDGAISFLEADSSAINPSLGFLTATYQANQTNIEFGMITIGSSGIPYANVFWRFK